MAPRVAAPKMISAHSHQSEIGVVVAHEIIRRRSRPISFRNEP